jgi:hypothetical protein
MSQVIREANVYFLPAMAATPQPRPAASVWRRLRAGCRRELWRMRFAFAGFRMALRRPRTPLFTEDETLTSLANRRAELIERRPRLSPARIIDFHWARGRLRPVPIAR